MDLENLRAFSFDESTGLATAGGGTLLGSLNEALWNSGHRYMPHGVSFSVGIGGHATVGGFGQASRTAGLATDHISEVQVVLANSSIVRTSASQHPDVFFAVRGAGASFGIVTEFVFETEPAPTSVVSYSYSWAAPDSKSRAELIQTWQKWVYTAVPWQLSTTLTVSSGGTVLYGTFIGTQAEFDALDFIGNFNTPDVASAEVYTDYRQLSADWDQLLRDNVAASKGYFYAKSLLWAAPETPIADDVVDRFIESLGDNDNAEQALSVNFELLGGYAGTIPVTATAYPHRDAKFAMLVYARTEGPVPQTTVDTLNDLDNMVRASDEDASHGQYAGFVDPKEDAEKARGAYWGVNLERLATIKATIDPDDVFHNPQSIRPM